MRSNQRPADASPARLHFIDGLRGIAALAVLVFHFNDRLEVPGVAGWIARHGDLGVALFFVLSGFVITMSVGDRQLSGSFLGRFVARRELRLGPSYYASIVVLLLIGIFGARFGANQSVPDLPAILAHLVYAQDLFGLPAMSKVYWTLCLEVQFYLFLVVGMWPLQRGASPSKRVGTVGYQAIMIASIAISLACRRLDLMTESFIPSWVMGSFIPSWYCFALGVQVYWVHAGWVDKRYALASIGLVLAIGMGSPWSIATALSAGGLLAAGKFGWMGALSNPVSQFFGRISYSLYLTHNIFGWYALSIALKFASPWIAAPVGLVVAIGSAWAWYWVLERPSVMLSRRVPMDRAQPVRAQPEAAA